MAAATVALVGAGRLGTRHLEGLLTCPVLLNIHVVETFAAAREKVRSHIAAFAGGQNPAHPVTFHERIATLPVQIDLAIEATTADVRLANLRELFDRRDIRYLLAEKILFQHEHDYSTAAQILGKAETVAWVNCPRRLWPVYQRLKQSLREQPLAITATGSGWAIGCNLIHMFDLASWLLGETEPESLVTAFDGEPIPAKRPGCLEMTGAISAVFRPSEEQAAAYERPAAGRVTQFRAECYRDGIQPFTVTIRLTGCTITINEGKGTTHVAKASGDWAPEPDAFTPSLQSQLTGEVANTILTSGTCALPDFHSSTRLHLKMLAALRPFFETHGQIEPGAPIPVT